MDAIYYQAPGKYFAAHPLTEPVEWEYVPGHGYQFRGEEWPAQNGPQPAAATVDSWDPQPEPSEPLTDVERLSAASTTAFVNAEERASTYLNVLKGKVHASLILSGRYDNAAATAEGVKFVQRHSVVMNAFKDCGGHPDAAKRLFDAINDSVADFSWLDGEILELFRAALVAK